MENKTTFNLKSFEPGIYIMQLREYNTGIVEGDIRSMKLKFDINDPFNCHFQNPEIQKLYPL
jgi:hypothetical protein